MVDAVFIEVPQDFAVGDYEGNDPIQNGGTLFVLDSADTASWPSQAAPLSSSNWVDLAEIANGTFSATPPGWSTGFVFNSASTAELVSLPTSSKLASNVAKYAWSIWYKHTGALSGTAGIGGVFASGSGFSNDQYSFHRASALVYAYCNAVQVGSYTITANTVYNLALTIELSGSTYTHKFWVNGALVATTTSASPMVTPSPVRATIGGLVGIFATSDDFVLYRAVGDNLTELTAQEWVELEYATRAGDFT